MSSAYKPPAVTAGGLANVPVMVPWVLAGSVFGTVVEASTPAGAPALVAAISSFQSPGVAPTGVVTAVLAVSKPPVWSAVNVWATFWSPFGCTMLAPRLAAQLASGMLAAPAVGAHAASAAPAAPIARTPRTRLFISSPYRLIAPRAILSRN